jgi:hypothetical protein
MSLVKLANIFTGGAIGKTLYNMRVAMKGGPKKYFSGKSENWFSPRKKLQETAISTASQTINEIRNGKPLNTTNIRGSFIDSMSGHSIQEHLGEYEKYINHKNKGINKATKYLTNKIIRKDGTIDIKNLENIMKKAKKVYNVSDTVVTKGKYLPIGGLVAGGGIGALRKPDNERSRKKNIIKGMFIGGTLGSGLKAGARSVKKALEKYRIPEIHDTYFADDYWKNRITKANSNPVKFVGKNIAKNVTFKEDKSKYRKLIDRIKNNEITGMP